MKKSKIITLGVLATTAVACHEPPTEIAHCVNPDGVVVDEALCNNDSGDAGNLQTTDDAGRVIYVPRAVYIPNYNPILFYRWYYGGYSQPVSPGTRIAVDGTGSGSFSPSAGHSYSTPSTFGRGGFGATGEGFGGGAGE